MSSWRKFIVPAGHEWWNWSLFLNSSCDCLLDDVKKQDVNFNILSKFPSSCDCFFRDYTYRLMAGCLINDNSTWEGISMHSFDDFETHYISVGFFGMHWYDIPLISKGIAATLCRLDAFNKWDYVVGVFLFQCSFSSLLTF